MKTIQIEMVGLTQRAIMQVAFGRVRRRIALLQTILLLRNARPSKVYPFVIMRFIACLRKS